MKRIPLIVAVLCAIVMTFIGCHKDPIEYGSVGVLNISLQRGCNTSNKSALESFDARVTIYYSTEDTIAYNCRFTDTDGDGRYTNDPSVLESIYVRRGVGFWVGVRAVIQGDTLTGMSDPNDLLYLPDENPLVDVTIVLMAGYPRIVISSNTEVVGEAFLIFGEVLEGMEMIEQYGFAVKRGQPSEEEKRLWAKRILTESDFDDLYSLWNYEFYDAEIYDNEAKRFGCALEMQDFDSAEYTVVAVAALRMTEEDSIPAAIHSPVVSMMISGGGAIPLYSQPTGYVDGYGYVDLGLPSGTLWAYCNVGATSPTDSGNYYAWGETENKETYNYRTYQYCNGSSTTLTKYCFDENYGNEGFVDSLMTLESIDDAASANWGESWRMPTQEEINELINNCTGVYITQNDINGYLFTGPNGNSIFLSAAGSISQNDIVNFGTSGIYLSNSLNYDPLSVFSLWINSDGSYWGSCSRFDGISVRPVCVQSKKKRK